MWQLQNQSNTQNIQFTVTYDKEKQQTHTLQKLEPEKV